MPEINPAHRAMLSSDVDCSGSARVRFCGLLVCRDGFTAPRHGVAAKKKEVVLVRLLRVRGAQRGDGVAAVAAVMVFAAAMMAQHEATVAVAVGAVAQDGGVAVEEVVGSGMRELREGWALPQDAGVIDEVFGDVRIQAVAFITKGDGEEGEAASRGENLGLRRKMRELQGALVVDAEV
jgi:hypothetical protein